MAFLLSGWSRTSARRPVKGESVSGEAEELEEDFDGSDCGVGPSPMRGEHVRCPQAAGPASSADAGAVAARPSACGGALRDPTVAPAGTAADERAPGRDAQTARRAVKAEQLASSVLTTVGGVEARAVRLEQRVGLLEGAEQEAAAAIVATEAQVEQLGERVERLADAVERSGGGRRDARLKAVEEGCEVALATATAALEDVRGALAAARGARDDAAAARSGVGGLEGEVRRLTAGHGDGAATAARLSQVERCDAAAARCSDDVARCGAAARRCVGDAERSEAAAAWCDDSVTRCDAATERCDDGAALCGEAARQCEEGVERCGMAAGRCDGDTVRCEAAARQCDESVKRCETAADQHVGDVRALEARVSGVERELVSLMGAVATVRRSGEGAMESAAGAGGLGTRCSARAGAPAPRAGPQAVRETAAGRHGSAAAGGTSGGRAGGAAGRRVRSGGAAAGGLGGGTGGGGDGSDGEDRRRGRGRRGRDTSSDSDSDSDSDSGSDSGSSSGSAGGGSSDSDTGPGAGSGRVRRVTDVRAPGRGAGRGSRSVSCGGYFTTSPDLSAPHARRTGQGGPTARGHSSPAASRPRRQTNLRGYFRAGTCGCCGSAGHRADACGRTHACLLGRCWSVGPAAAAEAARGERARRSVESAAAEVAARASRALRSASTDGGQYAAVLRARQPPAAVGARALRMCRPSVWHLPRGEGRARFARLLCRWLAEYCWLASDAAGGEVTQEGAAAPSLLVGPALVLAGPATSRHLHARMELAEAYQWGSLGEMVERQMAEARARRVKGRTASRWALARRARRLMVEGAVSRAVAALTRAPAEGRTNAGAVARDLARLFPDDRGDNGRVVTAPAASSAAPAQPLRYGRHAADGKLPPLGAEGEVRARTVGRGDENLTGEVAIRARRKVWETAVVGTLSRGGRLAAPGPSGLRAEHLREALSVRDGSAELVEALGRAMDLLTDGRVPPALRDGTLHAIPKAGGDGLRPLGAGEVLRKMAARLAMRHLLPEIEPRLQAAGQFGASAAGAQRASARIRQAYHGRRMGVVALDVSNAFNTVRRSAVLDAVPDNAPGRRLVHALYGQPCTNWLPGEGVGVACCRGVVQGCPLAALLFAAATVAPITEARAAVAEAGVEAGPLGLVTEEVPFLHPPGEDEDGRGRYPERVPAQQAPTLAAGAVACAWFADDGHVVGEPGAVATYVGALQVRLERIGLRLNPRKAEYLGVPPTEEVPEALRPYVGRSVRCLRALGAPVGDEEECGARARAVVREAADATRALGGFDHPQLTAAALRYSGPWSRVEYLLGLVPGVEGDHVAPLDRASRATLEAAIAPLVGEVDGPGWAQATLPLALGGLGIRSAEVEYPTALAYGQRVVGAAEFGAKAVAQLRGRRKRARVEADKGFLKDHLLPALEPEDRARLNEVAAVAHDRASWLAVQSLTGPALLPPAEAAVAIGMWLGLEVLPADKPICRGNCQSRQGGAGGAPSRPRLDPYGYHAAECSVTQSSRHAGIGDGFDAVMAEVGMPEDRLAGECTIGADGALRRRQREGGAEGDRAYKGCDGKWTMFDFRVCARRTMAIKTEADPRARAWAAHNEKRRERQADAARAQAVGVDWKAVGIGPYGLLAMPGLLRTAGREAEKAARFSPLVNGEEPSVRLLRVVALRTLSGAARGVLRLRDALFLPTGLGGRAASATTTTSPSARETRILARRQGGAPGTLAAVAVGGSGEFGVRAIVRAGVSVPSGQSSAGSAPGRAQGAEGPARVVSSERSRSSEARTVAPAGSEGLAPAGRRGGGDSPAWRRRVPGLAEVTQRRTLVSPPTYLQAVPPSERAPSGGAGAAPRRAVEERGGQGAGAAGGSEVPTEVASSVPEELPAGGRRIGDWSEGSPGRASGRLGARVPPSAGGHGGGTGAAGSPAARTETASESGVSSVLGVLQRPESGRGGSRRPSQRGSVGAGGSDAGRPDGGDGSSEEDVPAGALDVGRPRPGRPSASPPGSQ